MALKLKHSPLAHFSVANLYAAFVNLPFPKQIAALVVLGAALLLIVILPISLASGKIRSMKKEIGRGEQGITEIADKIQVYRNLQQEMADLEKRFQEPSGSVNSVIEAMAAQNNIAKNVEAVKPRPVKDKDYLEVRSVDVKLAKVSLNELVGFLYSVETNPQITMRVQKLEIKPKFSSRDQLDADLEIATFTLKKEL